MIAFDILQQPSDAFDAAVAYIRYCHFPIPNHIVDNDDSLGTYQTLCLFEVFKIALFVGVDECEVKRPISTNLG